MMKGGNILLSLKYRHSLKLQIRNTCKIAVELNKDVTKKLESEEIKPRHHPGVCKLGKVILPDYISKGIIQSIGDYPVKTLINEGNALSRYLNARHPPAEISYINKKILEIQQQVDKEFECFDIENMSEEEQKRYKDIKENKVKKILRQRIFAWKPINYGHFEALLYAVGRGSQEYAVLMKIFNEISIRDENFKPRSYFDFGAGIGTGMWAVSNVWKDSIFEYFNVDSSRDMNDLSDLILREGNENQQRKYIKNVFFRQFLPANENKYDIVLCGYTLFELPNAEQRRDVLLKLWKKCDKYMILVEEGTRFAFQLLMEARDFILNQKDGDVGHVFSPCPHDSVCPRISNTEDKTPCNFTIMYEPLQIGGNPDKKNTNYSYVVFKKGPRDENDETKDWPRIIRPPLVRARHTVCRTCTSTGNLQEIIFTAAKHGKFAYRCARSSNWGDRLPIKIGEDYSDKNKNLE